MAETEIAFDLDAARAARAEAHGETRAFRFGGEEFTLPPECPMDFLERLNADQGGAAIRALLSEDDAARFMAHAPSLEDLTELVKGVAKAYGIGGVGNSSASNGSSPNGSGRSRRTSNASTD